MRRNVQSAVPFIWSIGVRLHFCPDSFKPPLKILCQGNAVRITEKSVARLILKLTKLLLNFAFRLPVDDPPPALTPRSHLRQNDPGEFQRRACHANSNGQPTNGQRIDWDARART